MEPKLKADRRNPWPPAGESWSLYRWRPTKQPLLDSHRIKKCTNLVKQGSLLGSCDSRIVCVNYFVINRHKTAGNPANQEWSGINMNLLLSNQIVFSCHVTVLGRILIGSNFCLHFLRKKKVATKRSISWIHGLDKTATGHSDNWFGNRLQ